MDEFLIPLEEKKQNEEAKKEALNAQNEQENALKKENEALKSLLIEQAAKEQESPFSNAYEQYLAKKYYGDDFLGLKTKQEINFKSRSINEPIKQLTRINKALQSSDEALKNVNESGLGYGIEKKLNRFTGGFKEMDEKNAQLDNALINFANMSAQVTSRGGNNSNQEREEQRLRLGGDFVSSEERANRIAQQRKTLLDYFESEMAGLESLGYRLDKNSTLMQEYLKQKKKQDYINKNGGSKFDYAEYEESAYDEFAKAKKEQKDELIRLKR